VNKTELPDGSNHGDGKDDNQFGWNPDYWKRPLSSRLTLGGRWNWEASGCILEIRQLMTSQKMPLRRRKFRIFSITEFVL
jgi:hypothetical protein